MSSKLGLFVVPLLALTVPAAADVAVEREVTVSSQDADEYRPSIAYNGARDEYLVVWSDSWQFVVNPAPFRTINDLQVNSCGLAACRFVSLEVCPYHYWGMGHMRASPIRWIGAGRWRAKGDATSLTVR